MLNDTSLVRMVIDALAERNSWSYEEAFEKFYNSKICKGLSDRRTGMFTFAPREIVELVEWEVGGRGAYPYM
ncbi:MAG: hypothetical protein FWC75_04915 [Oscillospiraceae bacterium]|nr:hypothetical protein [Oscillospiraceae bacterium]